MSDRHEKRQACAVCGGLFERRDLIPGHAVNEAIASEILKTVKHWNSSEVICRRDLNQFRSRYVHGLLESEKGELTTLESEILDSLKAHDVLARNIETQFDQNWSLGERMADRIATFGGSWSFLFCFSGVLSIWIVVNSLVMFYRPFDPYPYILLNLILSCLASVQAPIIMMSQNRTEARDRLRSQHDYQVNLKAELEIRHLHEKLDHLLSHQWERLARIQEVQMEVLAELSRQRNR